MKKTLAVVLTFILLFVCIVGYTAQGISNESTLLSWDFESGTGGWGMVSGSPTQVSITSGVAETNALKFSNSWSYSNSWSNCIQICSPFSTNRIGETTSLSFEVFIQNNSSANGSLQIAPIIQSPEQNYWFQLNYCYINFSDGEDLGNGLLKFSFDIPITSYQNEQLSKTDSVGCITMVIIGGATQYSGDMYIDNVRLYTDPSLIDNSLKIEKLTVENELRILKGNKVTVTTSVDGGTPKYTYSSYVVKDGNIVYTRESSYESVFTFTPLTAGLYTIISYCTDGENTTVSTQKDINVLSELPEYDKYIAITFDDGPSSNTSDILSALKSRNAVATFFVCKNYTNIQNENMLSEIISAGCQIGNHTETHPYLTSLTIDKLQSEINNVNAWVYEKTGVMPTIYRPPYLSYNNTVLSTFPNMSAIGCSNDSKDWTGISSDEIIQNVLSSAKDGDIVLLHDPQNNTKNAVGTLIDGLQSLGFKLVTVDELFEIKGKTMNGATYYSSVQ